MFGRSSNCQRGLPPKFVPRFKLVCLPFVPRPGPVVDHPWRRRERAGVAEWPPAAAACSPKHYVAGTCCTTQRLNARITDEQLVLYRWHPWVGRVVVVHAIMKKASSTIARCSLGGEPSCLPLELPLWMFDRAACSAVRREDSPRVEITALSAVQALPTDVTGTAPMDPQIVSTDTVLSADLRSCDQAQGDARAPSSEKVRPVRAVRSSVAIPTLVSRG